MLARSVFRGLRAGLRPVRAVSSYQWRALSGDGDSHPDFAAQKKVSASNDNDVHEFLHNAVKDHDVLLFMKGSPSAPRCGFSKQTVMVLEQTGVDFSSADVLASDEIREGIKKYSDWPTIPQLYIQGEFIGGCDVVTDMYQSGELKELLEPVLTKQRSEKKASE